MTDFVRAICSQVKQSSLGREVTAHALAVRQRFRAAPEDQLADVSKDLQRKYQTKFHQATFVSMEANVGREARLEMQGTEGRIVQGKFGGLGVVTREGELLPCFLMGDEAVPVAEVRRLETIDRLVLRESPPTLSSPIANWRSIPIPPPEPFHILFLIYKHAELKKLERQGKTVVYFDLQSRAFVSGLILSAQLVKDDSDILVTLEVGGKEFCVLWSWLSLFGQEGTVVPFCIDFSL